MSKTIGVIFGLLNIIMLSFFVTQFDEKAILKYGERARKITECARISLYFGFHNLNDNIEIIGII